MMGLTSTVAPYSRDGFLWQSEQHLWSECSRLIANCIIFSILLPQSPGNSKLNCVQSVISEVSCWFVCKRFNPNRLSERLCYFFVRMMKFSG